MIPQNSPTDNTYSDRELDSKFASVIDKLDHIIVQTTRTNGRVTALEKWQSYVIGFCAAVSILLIPIFFKVFDKVL